MNCYYLRNNIKHDYKMERIKVKIINDSPYELPAYETHSAAGMDVRANIT